MIKTKLVTGTIQKNHYNGRNAEYKFDLIDCTEDVEERLNAALEEIQSFGAEIISVLSNTYLVDIHNNGGYNTIAMTYTITYREAE